MFSIKIPETYNLTGASLFARMFHHFSPVWSKVFVDEGSSSVVNVKQSGRMLKWLHFLIEYELCKSLI